VKRIQDKLAGAAGENVHPRVALHNKPFAAAFHSAARTRRHKKMPRLSQPAHQTGRLIVDMVRKDLRLSRILTRAASGKPPSKYGRGYHRLFIDHVLQADLGCDLDFL
jgi:hypothetical protein